MLISTIPLIASLRYIIAVRGWWVFTLFLSALVAGGFIFFLMVLPGPISLHLFYQCGICISAIRGLWFFGAQLASSGEVIAPLCGARCSGSVGNAPHPEMDQLQGVGLAGSSCKSIGLALNTRHVAKVMYGYFCPRSNLI